MGNSTFKKLRDGLQQGIYVVINPFVKFLIKMGVTPNMVTTIGFLGNLLAAAMFVYAGIIHRREVALDVEDQYQFGWIGWGGGILILFSLFDMLDGQVARIGNMKSTFGAMYDSVLDRYSELVTLGGITFYLLELQPTNSALGEVGALITFVALVGSIMVSYVRARAEGLDIECKVGLMQRPERVVITSLAALLTGIVGKCVPVEEFNALYILIGGMAIIAVFANITAFARIRHCRRELTRLNK
ncbi:MAG: CDP-alcohol phosphatidyltransferase family protein [Muribaculaceae bacterium]|nr:CDP-alcohol phosphatidyltransferase family protein [Bacteroides sp.]MDE7473383.1 CDP-alcohol phosphatidyltransferase family protein [Muribaculaceae bacterium]